MATEHEARVHITNLRTHLQANIGHREWNEIAYNIDNMEDCLNTLGRSGSEIRALLKKMRKAARERDADYCYNLFLLLNERLILDLNIPALVDVD